MSRTLLTASVFVFLAMGCRKTDLNASCRLVKSNPDGGSEPVAIRERELLVYQADGGLAANGRDFIGVGSVDCVELFCVRDSSWRSDAGLDDEAYGYCSKQCVPGDECPSFEESFDTGATALRCRGLLLSAEALASLKEDFPGIYQPDFCARSPDAGAQ